MFMEMLPFLLSLSSIIKASQQSLSAQMDGYLLMILISHTIMLLLFQLVFFIMLSLHSGLIYRLKITFITGLQLIMLSLSSIIIDTGGVNLQNNPGVVKGRHFVLPYDRSQLAFISADQSDELKSSPRPTFFDGRDVGGHVDVSLALLGGETVIGGSGEIARIKFRLLEGGELSISFDQIDVRDGENNPLLAVQMPQGSVVISSLPVSYDLIQNYPNPFNPETELAYQLPSGGHVSLNIYNITGQLVRTLVDEYKPAGYHQVVWDSKNSKGTAVASGTYLYRLDAGDYSGTKKMILLK